MILSLLCFCRVEFALLSKCFQQASNSEKSVISVFKICRTIFDTFVIKMLDGRKYLILNLTLVAAIIWPSTGHIVNQQSVGFSTDPDILRLIVNCSHMSDARRVSWGPTKQSNCSQKSRVSSTEAERHRGERTVCVYGT